MVGNS